MTLSARGVGIDISKAVLDVFDPSVGRIERVANTAAGIAVLVARWRGDDGVMVVFEATGVYDRALGAALHAAGVVHARVNPARARAFARACGLAAKTDAIDARMLSAFAVTIPARRAEPVSKARKALSALAKRRDQLVAARTQEKNRCSEAAEPLIGAHIRRHIAFLDREIKALDKAIATAIAGDADLARHAAILRSAPGVGPVATTQLLAAMPELGALDPKAAAALAGLAPLNADSGRFRGKRCIGGGRRRVRQALYMAALGACRTTSPFQDFYRRLRQAGKPAKLALIAVARKLLGVLNAMLRDDAIFRAA